MIEVDKVVKWFGPMLAVDNVSFKVERGEVLGFLGPNGAGKSTTMRLITGFLPFSSGKVAIGGRDIEEDPIEAKSRIGYLPENAPAYPEMTVTSFLHFVAEVRGLTGAKKKQVVERVIETCFLENVRNQPIDTLSKGYRHRTCFAQSILHDPPVLVLDEPTDGLDPNQKHEVRQLIKSMGEHKAIIVSTHILEEVDAICSRVIIIDRGKLVFNGTPDDLRSRSDVAGSVVVRVHGGEPAEVSDCLGSVAGVGRVELLSEDDGVFTLRAYRAKEEGAELEPANGSVAEQVAAALQERGWAFGELHTEQGRLDEVFRAITVPDTAQEGGA